MAEAVAALSLAANIAQFAGIGLDFTRKTRELMTSTSGLLKEHEEISKVMTDLSIVTAGMSSHTASSDAAAKALRDLVDTCSDLHGQLFRVFQRLEVQPGMKSRKRDSLRKASQAMWNKREIKDLETRLLKIRDEISFHLIAILRCVLLFHHL